ncbi:MAG TPA: hypothetical protein VFT61_02790 [Sphingomicrobium sp.]|jgi:hypothetical protein|nr:hypothetical protein [Sphingomicrobium sp.]
MAGFAARSDQGQIRKFNRGALGCTVNVATDEVDRYQLADTHFSFVWQDSALQLSDFLKATYLKLKADDPKTFPALYRHSTSAAG